MQTIPIANPANLISSTPPANKQNQQTQGNAPATSFNQVLSREVADRNNAGPKASETRAPQNVAPNQPKPAQTNSNETKAADKKEATEETDETATTDGATATPADMLALVASLNPARQTAGMADKKGGKQLADDTIKSGTDAAALAAIAGAAGDKTAALASGANKPATILDDKAVAKDSKLAPATHRGTDTSGTEELGADDGRQGPASARKTDIQDLAAKPAVNTSPKAGEVLTAGDIDALKNDFAADIKNALASVQAAAAPQVSQAVNEAAALATDRLAPQVGSAGWDKALGQKITWMVAGEQQTASLTLNPPDLGPLQVVLSVSNAQADATFTAAQPEVRQALEAAMPKLREMLSDAGIQLGQATVNSGSPNQQGGQEQKQFQPGAARVAADDGRAEPATRVGRVQPAAQSGRGLVDTFV